MPKKAKSVTVMENDRLDVHSLFATLNMLHTDTKNPALMLSPAETIRHLMATCETEFGVDEVQKYCQKLSHTEPTQTKRIKLNP